MKSGGENSGARRIIIPLVVLSTVCVLSLIVAGVTSLISLADRIHPVAGTIVFWSFFLAAGFFALYCVIAYARLPAALIPPAETSGPQHEAYLQALSARLAINPRTRDLPLATPEEIEDAVGHLSNEADKVVRRTASTVFLSTALMQNGRLDGLVVLVHPNSNGEPGRAHLRAAPVAARIDAAVCERGRHGIDRQWARIARPR